MKTRLGSIWREKRHTVDHAAIRGDVEKREGNKRGYKYTVGEAFTGRNDTEG